MAVKTVIRLFLQAARCGKSRADKKQCLIFLSDGWRAKHVRVSEKDR